MQGGHLRFHAPYFALRRMLLNELTVPLYPTSRFTYGWVEEDGMLQNSQWSVARAAGSYAVRGLTNVRNTSCLPTRRVLEGTGDSHCHFRSLGRSPTSIRPSVTVSDG